MNRVVTHKVRKRYARTEKQREDHASGGFTIRTVKVGEDDVDVTVTVDLDALVYRLGERAWHNKTGVAKYLFGVIRIDADKAKP